MSAAFHLRPVPDHTPSPPSSTTAPDRSPSLVLHPSAVPHRRPLSPSSLRDVNLSQDANPVPRKYPAPPTGHELMALFPPAPPTSFSELRQGSTSGFFQRQERAFFAQAGREILRARLEVDGPAQSEGDPHAKAIPRAWPQLPPHPQHHSPAEAAAAPPAAAATSPYPRSKAHRSMPGPPPSAAPNGGPPAAPTPPTNAVNMYPVTSPTSPRSQHQPVVLHPSGAPPPPPPLPGAPAPPSSSSPGQHHHHHHPSHHPHHPPHPSHGGASGLRTPPHDHHHPQQPPSGMPKSEYPPPDDYRDDAGPGSGMDDAWRRPTPYSDRRRAGKHTRRVIVRG
ncbi:hypothetical protein ID866_3272 [Astraeus odoratus]|nr:hypothetical protein ID866_3272 [Astraeus odoratus]